MTTISPLLNQTILPLTSAVIQEVTMPFGSLFKLAFKWQLASFLAFWLLLMLFIVVGATFGLVFGVSLAGIVGALSHAVRT